MPGHNLKGEKVCRPSSIERNSLHCRCMSWTPAIRSAHFGAVNTRDCGGRPNKCISNFARFVPTKMRAIDGQTQLTVCGITELNESWRRELFELSTYLCRQCVRGAYEIDGNGESGIADWNTIESKLIQRTAP